MRIEFKGTILDPTDATLRSLALSDASDDSSIALRPAFASSITSYTASVANRVDEITIAPTTTNNGARVAYLNSSDTAISDADTTKNGQQVSLAVDANTIKVQVTAADGTTPQPYTVTVTRTSTDATLSALALSDASDDSPIALSPAFASGTTSYTASVANGVDEITIAPTTTNNGARVAYFNGSDTAIPDADDAKNGQQVSLAVGPNTITVQVTAADSTATQPYTVTVTRAEPEQIPSTDATLSALALSNAADDSTIALSRPFASGPMRIYTASVPNGVEQITIAPTTTNNGARVAYLNSSDTAIPDADAKDGQQVSLAVGPNTITVQVTAADRHHDADLHRDGDPCRARADPQHRRDAERAGAVGRGGQFHYRSESGLRVRHHEDLHGVSGERGGADYHRADAQQQRRPRRIPRRQRHSDCRRRRRREERPAGAALVVATANTIKVQVTAADDTTTLTYTVTVTRAEPEQIPSSDATARWRCERQFHYR